MAEFVELKRRDDQGPLAVNANLVAEVKTSYHLGKRLAVLVLADNRTIELADTFDDAVGILKATNQGD